MKRSQKTIATLAALATIIGGVIAVAKACSPDPVRIDATVFLAPFHSPIGRHDVPDFDERFSLDNADSYVRLKVTSARSGEVTKDARLFAELVASQLLYDMQRAGSDWKQRMSERLDDVSLFSSAWYCDVRSTGDRPARGVALTLPGASLAIVNGGASFVVKKNQQGCGTVDLGDIPQGSTVSVIAWAGIEPNHYFYQDVRLRHAEGLGSVSTLEQVGGFCSWLSRNWLAMIGPAIMIVGVLLVLGSALASARRSAPLPPGDLASPASAGSDPME